MSAKGYPTAQREESMLYVVSYDIPNDRRRTRVHSALTGYGAWVQYSVFECFLTQKQRLLMEQRLRKEINLQEDTIRIYGLCGTCTAKMQVLGIGKPSQEDTIYML
jgi:CRISPR-associated protein Cas2